MSIPMVAAEVAGEDDDTDGGASILEDGSDSDSDANSLVLAQMIFTSRGSFNSLIVSFS